MSTPINLNKVRKARARAAKKVRADANAATFGMTKAEKDRAKRENSRFAPRIWMEKSPKRPRMVRMGTTKSHKLWSNLQRSKL